jgi:hypothetical protein
VRANPERNAELRRQIGDLFQRPRFVSQVFATDPAPTAESVLMLSDSFGDLASEAFAGAFRQLIQVDTNELQAGRGQELIDRLQRFEPLQRVILLLREGGEHRLSILLDQAEAH